MTTELLDLDRFPQRAVIVLPDGSPAILVFDKDQPRDPTGKWRKVPGGDLTFELTPDERAASWRYTDGFYGLINDYLRGGHVYKPDDLERHDLPGWVEQMDSAIAHQPRLDEPVTVYRGTRGNKIPELQVGDTWQDKGYLSTTKDEDLSHNFIVGDPVLFTITVPEGTQLLDVDRANASQLTENEMILHRGSRFRVDRVGHRAGTRQYWLTLLSS